MNLKRACFTLGLALAAALFLPAVEASAQQVTVYTAGPEDLATALARGFQNETGTKVSVFQGTTGQVMARLDAERANPQADVLISASWDTAADFQSQGLLLPYSSPNAAKVPDQLKGASYVAQAAAALAIIWNPESGKPRPGDWSDLATPAYANAVAMPDPASSGSSYGLLAGLVGNPAYGWKFIETLKANGTIVYAANAQALNPVMQGAKAAVLGGVDYIALGAQKNGEAIEVIYPASGTVLEARPAMVLKSARNPQGAKRFIDYLLSDTGQKLAAADFLLPGRTDVAALRPGWSDIKLMPAAANVLPDQRTATLARFKAAMGMK